MDEALQPLSGPFVTSFIRECLMSGLTKEATAVALRRVAVEHLMGSPHFKAGFEKAAAEPGSYYTDSTLPIYDTSGQSNFGNIARGGAIGGAALGGLAGLRFGGGKLKGLGRVARKGKLGGALALLGGLAGGIGGAVHGAGKDTAFQRAAGGINSPFAAKTPALGPYDPVASQKRWDTRMEDELKPVAALNKGYEADRSRMQLLQKAIDTNAPDAGVAMRELQGIQSRMASDYQRGVGRDAHADEMFGQQMKMKTALDEIQAQKADLAKQNPHSFINRVRTRFGDNRPAYFASEAARLAQMESNTANELKFLGQKRHRLVNGYDGSPATPPETADKNVNPLFSVGR